MSTRSAPARRSRRSLSRLDWIRAGQRQLISDGFAALKLATLTRELGVTSGSFYHHFVDFRDYLDALADYYGGENIEQIRAALSQFEDPAERLRLMLSLREEWDIARLDSAMRVWASADERARHAVARLDDQLLELFRAAFAELGFSYEEARVRALLAFTAGVGQPFLFGRPPNPADASAALELLMRGPGEAAAG